MERKAHNSLYEAALQVQLGEVSKPLFNRAQIHRKRAAETAKQAARAAKSVQSRTTKRLAARNAAAPHAPHVPRTASMNQTFADKLFTRNLLRAHVEYDDAQLLVLEYFENYFGDNLNEDTSDEDILKAIHDLIDLTEAVLEAFHPNLKSKLHQRVRQKKGVYKKPPPLLSRPTLPPQWGHKKQPQRGQDPKADYRADRDKHMNTKFSSQAARDASWANRKNWGR